MSEGYISARRLFMGVDCRLGLIWLRIGSEGSRKSDQQPSGGAWSGRNEIDRQGDEARNLLQSPLNPNGRSNADVVARLYDIDDVVGRDSDRWRISPYHADSPVPSAW